jgi:MFS family permease
VRLISALGGGVFAPAAFSLIGDLYGSEHRGRATGIVLSAGTLGALIAAGLLPTLAARAPDAWRLGFAAMGLASCLTGLLLFLGMREPPRGGGEPELRGVIQGDTAPARRISWADLRALSAIASWRLLALTEALRAVGASLVLGWLFTWLASIGLASSIILIVAAFMISIFVGQLAFGWLSDYLARRFPRYGQLTLTLIGLLLVVPMTMLFVASDGQNVDRLVIYALLSGFTGAVGVVIWPIGQAVVPPELRGSSRAITEVLAGGAGAAALVASGQVVEQLGVATALLRIAPLPVALSVLLWLPLFHTFPRDRQALHRRLELRRARLSLAGRR